MIVKGYHTKIWIDGEEVECYGMHIGLPRLPAMDDYRFRTGLGGYEFADWLLFRRKVLAAHHPSGRLPIKERKTHRSLWRTYERARAEHAERAELVRAEIGIRFSQAWDAAGEPQRTRQSATP